MFFFFLDRPRLEFIDYLSKVVTNRDTLNQHVRELQLFTDRPGADPSARSQYSREHESWSDEELGAVLDNGLDVLSDERLGWLRYNPIALFELFDAINEALPSQWMDLLLADAQRLWEGRPISRQPQDHESPSTDEQQDGDDPRVVAPSSLYLGLEDVDEFEQLSDTLERLVTSRDELVEHVRKLRRESHPVATDSWPDEELQRVLEGGLQCLPEERQKWLRGNPIALFELFDAINESLPSFWMELVLADARRLYDSRPGAGQ